MQFTDEVLGTVIVPTVFYHTAVLNNGKLVFAAYHRYSSNHVLIFPVLSNNKPWRSWFSIQDRRVFVMKKLQVK